jgi:uncharacterized protein (TIGR00251 family)
MLTLTRILQNSRDRMEISVKVVPNSKKMEVIKIDDRNYKIRVDAPAVEGKANKRLIEILSYYFDVSKSSISIIRGVRERKKTIKIDL